MRPVYFLVPGDLDAPTGGYAYARALIRELPNEDVPLAFVRLPDAYPFPAPNDIAETERLLAQIPRDAILLIDGLAYGAMPEDVVAAIPQTIVALVHHPLGFESGLEAADKTRLISSERAALRHADRVIATSAITAATLTETFGISSDCLSVAEPGVADAERAIGSGGPAVSLLTVGAISARKGYDVLVTALKGIAANNPTAEWSCRIIGSADRDRETADQLKAQIRSANLTDRIEVAGAVDDATLATAFHRADAFVLSSRYEGYGMVLTEALSRGLPIVSTTGGAAAETAPDDAALKVPPDNAEALQIALEQIILDGDLRETLRVQAWAHARALPRWRDTARTIASVLKECM